MKNQKWYLLIISLLSWVFVCAQDQSSSWMIDNLSLKSVIDKDDKMVLEEKVFNLPVDAKEVLATFGLDLKLSKQLGDGETLPEKPEKIWYSWDGGASKQSFEPDYTPKEGEDNVWSITVAITVPIPESSSDITFIFGLSEAKLSYSADGLVRVWSLPDAPSLSPQTYSTFTKKNYSFEVKELSDTKYFSSRFSINGKNVPDGKIFKDSTQEDIGDQEYVETNLTLDYSYSYGDKVWVKGTLENAAKLITYHRPVYKYSIKVNDQAPINTLDTTITHSDKVELIVEHDNYGYGNVFTPSWSGKGQSYTAENNGDSEKDEKSTVTMTNETPDGVVDSLDIPFKITVLPVIKVENDIAIDSYSFIPDGDTKIAVKKIHNQENLTWDWNWKFGGDDINGVDSFDKNEITLSANQLKEAKDYNLVATVSCYYENNKNKKYLDGETINYKIHVVPNPEVISYGDFIIGQEDIITCHDQIFKVTIEPKGGYKGNNAFHFELKDKGGEYGHSKQTEGTFYEITYKNNGEDVVESDFSFFGTNTIPKDVSTTGKKETREVEKTNLTFHATIYPYPQVQFKDQLVNYFYGSKISKELKNNYPSPPTGNEWKFTWKFDDVIQEDFKDKDFFQLKVPDGGDSDSTVHKLRVIGENYYKGKKWGEQDLPLDLTAWHRAQLDGIKLEHEGTDNANIYEGHTFNLAAITQYGYPEGWRYTWKRKDKDNTLSSKESDEFQAEFSGSKGSEEQTYELIVENGISKLDEVPFTATKTKDITVWKKAENYNPEADDSYIKITDTQNGASVNDRIREGRVLKLEVPEAKYGYKNDWTYTWNGTETKNNQTLLTVPNALVGGEAMYKESKSISLTISNVGPNGLAWEERPITKSYTVYREPRTPATLAKKGNGASRTLVATMAITDDQLQQNDYYLCFGHLESNGNVTIIGEPQKQQGAGQTRFMTQVPQDLWNDTDNLCVFALWHYDDGVWITSNLRFITDDAEVVWDGSDYIGEGKYSSPTRGDDVTGIFRAESLSPEIHSAYRLDGLRSSKLSKGINIIKMSDGVVHKVIIK